MMVRRFTPLIGTLAFPISWAVEEWIAATTDLPIYFSYGQGGTTRDIVLKVNFDNSPESVISFKRPGAAKIDAQGACQVVEKTSMLELYPNAFNFERYFFAKGPFAHSPQDYAIFCWKSQVRIGGLPTQGDPIGHECFWTWSDMSNPPAVLALWVLKCTSHPRLLKETLPSDSLGNWRAVPSRHQACFLYLAGPFEKPYLTIQCIKRYNAELQDLPAFKNYHSDSQINGGNCRLILKADADVAFPELDLPDSWFTAVTRSPRLTEQYGVYCERNDFIYDTRHILPRIRPLGHKCYWTLDIGDKRSIFVQCEDAEDWRYA